MIFSVQKVDIQITTTAIQFRNIDKYKSHYKNLRSYTHVDGQTQLNTGLSMENMLAVWKWHKTTAFCLRQVLHTWTISLELQQVMPDPQKAIPGNLLRPM